MCRLRFAWFGIEACGLMPSRRSLVCRIVVEAVAGAGLRCAFALVVGERWCLEVNRQWAVVGDLAGCMAGTWGVAVACKKCFAGVVGRKL